MDSSEWVRKEFKRHIDHFDLQRGEMWFVVETFKSVATTQLRKKVANLGEAKDLWELEQQQLICYSWFDVIMILIEFLIIDTLPFWFIKVEQIIFLNY